MGQSIWDKKYILGCGEVIELPIDENVFLPSPAGVFFWETLYRKKLSDTNKCKKLLDLGCGSGFLSIAMALHGFRSITASDINLHHIEYASRQSVISKKY